MPKNEDWFTTATSSKSDLPFHLLRIYFDKVSTRVNPARADAPREIK